MSGNRVWLYLQLYEYCLEAEASICVCHTVFVLLFAASDVALDYWSRIVFYGVVSKNFVEIETHQPQISLKFLETEIYDTYAINTYKYMCHNDSI